MKPENMDPKPKGTKRQTLQKNSSLLLLKIILYAWILMAEYFKAGNLKLV